MPPNSVVPAQDALWYDIQNDGKETAFNMLIRDAECSDAPILAILCEQLGYPVLCDAVESRLQHILSDSAHQCLRVAILPEVGVVGWVHVHIVHFLGSDPFAEIGGLVVDAAHRRGGAGRALMRSAEAWACSRGLKTIRLRSNVLRKDAHQFYQGLGYELTKTQYTFQKETIETTHC